MEIKLLMKTRILFRPFEYTLENSKDNKIELSVCRKKIRNSVINYLEAERRRLTEVSKSLVYKNCVHATNE